MTHYIYNYETEFDFTKLIIGNQIKIDTNTFRYYIYYLDDTPKDLFIKLPSIRLIYNYKNNKYTQIKLPIYPVYDKTEALILFFKKLEKIIKERLKLNKLFVKTIDKKDKIKLLKINIANDFKINKQNNLLITDLQSNGEINGFINLGYIWETETSFGLSTNIAQINYKPKIDTFSDEFLDFDIIKKPIKIINKNSETNNKNKNIDTVFKISSDLLLKAITKLNHVSNN